MTSKILLDMAPQLSDFLTTHGFNVVREDYDDKSFGDAFVEARSPSFRISVSRDKGDVLIDVGPPKSASWHKLETVLAFVDPEAKYQREGSPPEVVALTHGLEKNFGKVEQLFADATAWPAFLDFERDRTNKLIDKLIERSKRFQE